jgi:hypothetical protein
MNNNFSELKGIAIFRRKTGTMQQLTQDDGAFISQIHLIRGQRVMLDADLAAVYGVETKYVKRAVKRNPNRFPPEFMFELTKEEFSSLKFQIGTSSWGGNRYLPYAFTEHGAIMLASVLNSEAAIQASIFVVKAFVKMRNMVGMYHELEQRMSQLEGQFEEQGEKIEQVLQVLRRFMEASETVAAPRKTIGFKRKNED